MSLHSRGFIAAALIATAPVAVLAQPSPGARAPAASAAASAASTPPASSYKSAFEGYRRFEDQKVLPWRESNDLVGRIGGWQAYARESAGEPVPAAAGNEKAPAPSTGNQSSSSSGGAATPLAPAASTPGPGPAPVKTPAGAAPQASPSSPSHGGHTGHKTP